MAKHFRRYYPLNSSFASTPALGVYCSMLELYSIVGVHISGKLMDFEPPLCDFYLGLLKKDKWEI